MSKKIICIVSPCYNEQDNIEELYRRIQNSIDPLRDNYNFEILFIDNNSDDDSVKILRNLASSDKSVKVILNARNFGHIRSPYYGILQSEGDATIYLASDLQDPPELIPEFVKWWEHGYKLVMATKPQSQGSKLMHSLRQAYYKAVDRITDIKLVPDATGFGLYDAQVIKKLKLINDPYPFLRGLICELGYKIRTVEFNQPRRIRGFSKNNFYTLYDIAVLGMISHSKLPLRLATFIGFIIGSLSFVAALVFTVAKIVFWSKIPVGIAPILIVVLFMFGVMMILIGILGEYVGSIHTYVQNRPIVVEESRINF